MVLTPDVIQKIEEIAEAAYRKIGAADARKQIDLTLKFAQSQPPAKIILDGKTVEAIAVDMASVWSPGDFRTDTDENGVVRTLEYCRVLSLVITDSRVCLCKCGFEVVPGATISQEHYINALYWTTTVDRLTEQYIC
jgi:hypothetical protein